MSRDAIPHLVERRESQGSATFSGTRLDAADLRDAELVTAVERLASAARAVLLENMDAVTSARFVASARRAGVSRRDEVLFELRRAGHSVVSTPEHLAADAALLRTLPVDGLSSAPHAMPHAIVWKNGSAAVLLHEAIGHATESAAPAIDWPEWLSVRDVPSFAVDDCGDATAVADLVRRQPPRARRRETFRDVPLPRMCGVHVECGATFGLPEQRVEVQLVGGGTFDAVRDEVTLRIAAASLVDGATITPLRPFVFTALRTEIAQAIRGAAGPQARYPGVICSREGQDVYVESMAPDVLTVFA